MSQSLAISDVPRWRIYITVAEKIKVERIMEFNLSEILPDGCFPLGNSLLSIVKIESDLLPVGFQGHLRLMQTVQQRISDILDLMGAASAKAQELKQPITSGAKLRMQDEHCVYLLVNRAANEVVGLLKAGKKNLFLLNEEGHQREVYPMCVLDFYVHESRQRSGCGKMLFEAMLKDQKVVDPKYLAVDRPSPKLLAFLRKHYGLCQKIQQFNNYVIFHGFFDNRPFDAGPGKRPRLYMGKLQYV